VLSARARAQARSKSIVRGRCMPKLNPDRRHQVSFILNGKATSMEVESRMLLCDALRHIVGATGTHVGCEHGVCGACTVIVDGLPARSCLMLAVQAQGCDIRTVEGTVSRPALGAASSLPPPSRSAVWFLYRRYPHVAAHLLIDITSAIGGGVERGHWWPPLPLHRLCTHSRGGARSCRHTAPGVLPCLILERAFLQASPAIRKRSPLSTATFG